MPKPYSTIQGLDLDGDEYYLICSIFHHLKSQGLPPVPFSLNDESVKALREALRTDLR